MRSGRFRARDSYIVRFFTFLTNFVYHMISAGFIGRVFTSYTKVDRVFRASRVGRLSTATERSGGRLHRAIRRNIAIAMNQSMISGGVKALFRLLCQCSLRTFGLFFVTSGSYSAIMYWLFSVIWQNGRVEVLNLFSGIAALILGIMLLFSDASLGYALSKGLFFQKILIEVFGVSDDALCDVPQLGKQGHVIAVPLGMVIGAVSALTSPIYLLVGALAFLLLALVLSVPEAGVLLLILFVPFAGFLPHSAYWIAFLVAVPLVAYLGKLLRGNRAFHMEVQDLPVLLMLVLFVLSGFSVAGKGAFAGALLSALLVGFYFLVVNVIATSRWLDRCRVALIVSATAASLLGIVQFIYAAAWSANGAPMPTLGGHVYAGFADHTTFAYFLVLAFPFALSAFVGAKKQYRLPAGFAMITVIAACVLTWVQSAWVAMLLMLIAFLLLYTKNAFPFVLVGGALTPVLIAVLPDPARKGFLSTLSTDSGTAIARNTGAGHLAANMFFENGSGVFARGAGFARLLFGLGNGGIEQFSMLYTATAPSVVARSMNFWLYRLLEGGILGVLLPVAFFFLFYQNCFSLLRSTTDKGSRFSAITGIVMATGVLILSIFRYAWYDPAALLLFFLASALIAADARYARAQSPERETDAMLDSNAFETEYYGSVR